MVIKCPKCHSESPDTSHFCAYCGTQLLQNEESQSSRTQTLEIPAEGLARGTVFAGRYEIIEQLGKGGMGTVYLAQQEKPIKRKVAIKIVKPGMNSEEIIARFESEQQALALMNHPNIAHVYDSGSTEQGYPYFVMEYVPGMPSHECCDRDNMAIQERLRLFQEVCNAIQHAHYKGIIHRDIKPSNVLVTLRDKKYIPKIIDFGIAKALTGLELTAKSLHTQHNIAIGTPVYMSPEQAELTGYDIDTRTDVYSLGILLHELLVGATPFDEYEFERAGLVEILRIIREVEPPKPSVRFNALGESSNEIAKKRGTTPVGLLKELRGDLECILMKAIEKDRKRRYDSASELEADIERYIKNEPVNAHPPSIAYRLGKFLRRNRNKAIMCFAIFLVSLMFLVSLILYNRYKIAYLKPRIIYPNEVEGIFYKDALVSGSLQISPAKRIRSFRTWDRIRSIEYKPIEGLPDWFHVKETSIMPNGGVGILFVIDTSRARRINSIISIDNGFGRQSCEFRLHILDMVSTKDKILFAESPIQMNTSGKELSSIMRIINENKIPVDFLGYEPEGSVNLSNYASIVLHRAGLWEIEKKHMELIYSYIENGGNLVILASGFMPSSVDKANMLLAPFRIKISENDLFEEIVCDQENIRKCAITDGVNSLIFFRPSPIKIESSEKTRIIVSNPKNKDEGFVVVYENKGRIIVIGESLYSDLTGSELFYDNHVLFKNLLKLSKKEILN